MDFIWDVEHFMYTTSLTFKGANIFYLNEIKQLPIFTIRFNATLTAVKALHRLAFVSNSFAHTWIIIFIAPFYRRMVKFCQIR